MSKPEIYRYLRTEKQGARGRLHLPDDVHSAYTKKTVMCWGMSCLTHSVRPCGHRNSARPQKGVTLRATPRTITAICGGHSPGLWESKLAHRPSYQCAAH